MASPLPRRFTFDRIKESSLLVQSRVDSVATNMEIDGIWTPSILSKLKSSYIVLYSAVLCGAEYSVRKPAFGQSLSEHLASHGCEISTVIDECVAELVESGLHEEVMETLFLFWSKTLHNQNAMHIICKQNHCIKRIDRLTPYLAA